MRLLYLLIAASLVWATVGKGRSHERAPEQVADIFCDGPALADLEDDGAPGDPIDLEEDLTDDRAIAAPPTLIGLSNTAPLGIARSARLRGLQVPFRLFRPPRPARSVA